MGCLVLLLSTPILVAWSGFIISKLWLWFMVPLGLSPIEIAHAIGLMVMVDVITFKSQIEDKSESEFDKWFRIIFQGLFCPGFLFFVGWVCYTQMP